MLCNEWKNCFDKQNSLILKGRNEHTLEVLASLAILGPSTTREMAKFAYPKRIFNENEIVVGVRSHEQIFYKLLTGRPKMSGKKKLGRYSGLSESVYIQSYLKSNSKNKTTNYYSLSMLGTILSLGFNFSSKSFKKLLDNTAKSSLFFAYIHSIEQVTSIDFVQTVFFKPINNAIKQYKISLDDNFKIFHSLICENIGQNLYDKIIIGNIDSYELDTLINNNWHSDLKKEGWTETLIDYYFTDRNLKNNLYENFDYENDPYLTLKTMRAIHYAYYSAHNFTIPPEFEQEPFILS